MGAGIAYHLCCRCELDVLLVVKRVYEAGLRAGVTRVQFVAPGW
jgi:hypothetical protein